MCFWRGVCSNGASVGKEKRDNKSPSFRLTPAREGDGGEELNGDIIKKMKIGNKDEEMKRLDLKSRMMKRRFKAGHKR